MGRPVMLLEAEQPWCECRDGEKIFLSGYEQHVAAANIALADAVWFTESQFYAKLGFPL
jgi:hypothetical protein